MYSYIIKCFGTDEPYCGVTNHLLLTLENHMRATGPLFTQSFPPSEILLTKQFNSRREAQHFQNFIQLANKFSYLKAILGCEQARNYIPLLILAKLLPSRKTGSPYTFQTKKLKYIVEYEGHKLIINADATFELAN